MGRGLVAAVAVGILGWSGIAIAGNQKDRPTHPAAQAALRYFESVRNRGFETLLRELRRPAPPAASRALILENLPIEGGLSPTDREARKLSSLRPLLRWHDREDSIEVRLFTYGGGAFTGLYDRTVLLISKETLGPLNTDELVAMCATSSVTIRLGRVRAGDTAGERSSAAGARVAVRRDCRHRPGSPRRQSRTPRSSLTKLSRHNARVGTSNGVNEARYVPLEHRVWFIRAMITLTASSPGSTPR